MLRTNSSLLSRSVIANPRLFISQIACQTWHQWLNDSYRLHQRNLTALFVTLNKLRYGYKSNITLKFSLHLLLAVNMDHYRFQCCSEIAWGTWPTIICQTYKMSGMYDDSTIPQMMKAKSWWVFLNFAVSVWISNSGGRRFTVWRVSTLFLKGY
jgi:hypothetical protein